MQNREIYLNDPLENELANNGVAEVKDDQSQESLTTLRYELNTFVCDGAYAAGMDKILSTYIRNVKGFQFNHKRVYRIYCELALNLRIKPKRRIKRPVPEVLKEPEHINDIWSLDFMHDQMSDGQSYRLLNIIDDYKREGLAMEVGLSLPASRVIRTLNQLLEYRTTPQAIRCDNGPEFTSHEFQNWAVQKGIRIDYIQPGKPQQNAYIERYNRTVRYGLLNQNLFKNLNDVEDHATRWLWFYNHERPHQANGGKPPLMNI